MLRVALALVVLATTEPRVTTIELDDDLLSRGRLGGVSVDDEGFIYVSDFGSTIWRISPEGGVEVLDNSLQGSSGNAIDSAGNLYQASFRDNRIVRIDRTGKLETYASDGLDGPIGITIGRLGKPLRLQLFGQLHRQSRQQRQDDAIRREPRLRLPQRDYVRPEWLFHRSQLRNGYLVRVSPDGEARNVVEVPEGRNAHVAATEDGLYVTKIESNRIYRIDRCRNHRGVRRHG